MEKDYSYLEGKEIELHSVNSCPQIMRGIVTGCDFDIGITIQEKGKTDSYLACLWGPGAPEIKGARILNEKEYKALFLYLVKEIESGLLRGNDFVSFVSGELGLRGGTSPTAESCPFGQ